MAVDPKHRAIARRQAIAFSRAAKAGEIPVVPWLAAQKALRGRTYKITALSGSSWKVVPGRRDGWFYILWAPGVLVLAGDAGDLRLEHHHAMPTINETLRWLQPPGDEHYLLGKSSARRVLDRRATARFLMEQTKHDKDLRKKLQDVVELFSEKLTEDLIENHIRDQMDHEVAEFCFRLGYGDYYGSYSYDDNDRRMVGLIHLWAELMRRQRAVGITEEELAA